MSPSTRKWLGLGLVAVGYVLPLWIAGHYSPPWLFSFLLGEANLPANLLTLAGRVSNGRFDHLTFLVAGITAAHVAFWSGAVLLFLNVRARMKDKRRKPSRYDQQSLAEALDAVSTHYPDGNQPKQTSTRG
jgi:hypothetical protein